MKPAHHYLPLPTITAPAHPFCRWPQYFSDFFLFIFHTIFQEYDDKREKFEQNQQTFLMNFPDSASFYNAKVCFQLIRFYFF